MHTPVVTVGIMQRNAPLNPRTTEALHRIPCQTIVVDASPVPVVRETEKIRVVHVPDEEGFFEITLLIPLFAAFLETSSDKLLLIEGDMVLTPENIAQAERCTVNTKAWYAESDPSSPHAYARREGLAGVLLRSECEKMYRWMSAQPISRFRRYQGYCDTFLWYGVSNESTGYSVSTSGPDWIRVLHMTHDDTTRVTKKDRQDMKLYRDRMTGVINIAMECNRSL